MFSDYNSLEEAFNYYNEKLFEGKLEPCVITLARKKGTRGFYKQESFKHRSEDQRADEISMNPDCFDRPDIEVLSTLVHEMCHKAQYQYGKPSRPGYHNKDWGNIMEGVGLMPSASGEEGGKRTGQKMTHYIIPGGRFDLLTNKFIEGGFKINWGGFRELTGPDGKPKAPKKPSKIKYSCPICEQNAWAKPGALLMCGVDKEMLNEEVKD